jgi:small-conductance mechanosensitive channel
MMRKRGTVLSLIMGAMLGVGLMLGAGAPVSAQQTDAPPQPATTAPVQPTADQAPAAPSTTSGQAPQDQAPKDQVRKDLAPAAKAAAPAGISADQARQTLDVLQNDAKRNQLIQVLQTIVAAPTANGAAAAPAATPPAPPAPSENALPVPPLEADSLGAQLLEQGAAWLDDAATTIAHTARNVADLPRVWTWLVLSLGDPQARNMLFNAIWRLAAVIGCAVIAEYALRFIMRRPLYLIERRAAYLHGLAGLGGGYLRQRDADFAADGSPEAEVSVSDPGETTPSDIDPGAIIEGSDGIVPRDASGMPKPLPRGLLWLRRIPWAFLHFLLGLLPVMLFAVIGNTLLGTSLADPRSVRLAGVAAVNAYVLVRVINCVVRLVVMSRSPGLRLLPLHDETAAYVEVWSFRLLGTALYGGAVSEMALVLGLSPSGHDTLLKIVFLLVAIYVVIIILQSRHTVAQWLRARPGRTGLVAAMLNRLASLWHVFGIFLVLALWLVWAMEIRHGFTKLLNFSLIGIGVLVVARLITLLLHAAFDRLFNIDDELEKRFPGLKSRANLYYPLLRAAISAAIAAIALVALLQAWGLDAVDWFHGDEIGSRLISAITTVAIASLVAVGVWEGSNLAIDRHMMKLDRSGDYAHAARLRTLVPILKTVLLVVVSIVVILTILSEIGVNIAPLLAGASIVGVAIGFGSQKLVQDFITGIFLLLENAMQVGDSITASGLSGTVEKLSIRTIRLRAGDGAVHIIPFSSVGTVTNINRGVGNAAVKVTVAASEDVDKVGEVLKGIAREMRNDDNYRHMMRSDLQLWGVDEIQAGAITIAGQIACSDSGRWGVQREFNRRLIKKFNELGIKLASSAQYVVLSQAGDAPAIAEVDETLRAAAMTEAPEEGDSATSVRASPPPSALGHTE